MEVIQVVCFIAALIAFVMLFMPPSLSGVTKLLQEIKILLEVIEKRGRK